MEALKGIHSIQPKFVTVYDDLVKNIENNIWAFVTYPHVMSDTFDYVIDGDAAVIIEEIGKYNFFAEQFNNENKNKNLRLGRLSILINNKYMFVELMDKLKNLRSKLDTSLILVDLHREKVKAELIIKDLNGEISWEFFGSEDLEIIKRMLRRHRTEELGEILTDEE